jgi:hypothetical protein
MSIITEQDPRLPSWLNTVLNTPPFAIDAAWIIPVLCICLGFKRNGSWVLGKIGRGPGQEVLLSPPPGYDNGGQMFWNGIFEVRFMLPFYVNLMIRWSDKSSPSYFQFQLGWKQNGRFALAFRFLDDASAAAGSLSPNTNLAGGFNEGTA